MERAFSPHECCDCTHLGRCPRLAWQRAFGPPERETIEIKKDTLHELNLLLEKLRVLWRLVHERKFISQQQLFFAITKIDEIGRMTLKPELRVES